MGWLFQDYPVPNAKAELDRIAAQAPETLSSEVVDSAIVGGAYYAATRYTDKATGRTCIVATIILFKNSQKHGFGYKDLTESMAPAELTCPLRILDALSPIDATGWDRESAAAAARWRAAVREHHAARAASG